MNDFVIYIRVEQYLYEWLKTSFGFPVRFPNRSFENALLHRYVTKLPPNATPCLPDEGCVPVVIPDSELKPKEYYNYMGERGKRQLISWIENLFRMDLWSSISPAVCSDYNLNETIDYWCRKKGISIDVRETVRQKFYRMRKSYRNNGVILGKTYAKKLPL